jgi:hypothetical protein
MKSLEVLRHMHRMDPLRLRIFKISEKEENVGRPKYRWLDERIVNECWYRNGGKCK